MTYLDPNQTRSERVDIGKWTVRALAVLIIAALGWYAFTVGTDRNGRPDIASEPGDVRKTETPLTEQPPLAE